jgi:hypothetical protein
MVNVTIPGPVTNNLRQGLTLRMGSVIEALDQASLIDRSERSRETFAEHFEQTDAIRGLFSVLGWERVNLDPADAEVDLGEHRVALEAGLDQATEMLRWEAKEGSPDQRQQAVDDLAEIERFAASLAALG